MECGQAIEALRTMADEKHKANVVRMGIPEHCSIGVSTGDIRKMAKTIGKSNELAYELWQTGLHEAKLLAVLLFDKKQMTFSAAGKLMDDVISWDLCDHLCKNLIIKLKGYDSLIAEWVVSEQTYKKRGAFTLMAASVVHEKNMADETLEDYLHLISENSNDEREHVKKAVSWALREIGKKDFNYNEKAVLLAMELKENGSQAQRWIGKDALKELQNLVEVPGRGRLISATSKMGKEA